MSVEKHTIDTMFVLYSGRHLHNCAYHTQVSKRTLQRSCSQQECLPIFIRCMNCQAHKTTCSSTSPIPYTYNFTRTTLKFPYMTTTQQHKLHLSHMSSCFGHFTFARLSACVWRVLYNFTCAQLSSITIQTQSSSKTSSCTSWSEPAGDSVDHLNIH